MIRILDKFDKWLVETRRHKKKTSHYSTDAGTCNKQLVYNWLGVKETDPPSPGSILKMKYGDKTEEILEEFFHWQVENNYIDAYDTQYYQRHIIDGLDYPISMRLDFVIYPHVGQPYGIELKSSFARGIVDIQKSGEPKQDYLKQIFIYTSLTPFKTFNHTYIARDSGYRTEFEIKLAPDGLLINGNRCRNKIFIVDMTDIINKFKTVEKHLKDKTEPPRDFKVAIKDGEFKHKFQKNNIEYKSDWQCSYCNWKTRCWANYLSQPNKMFYGEEEIK